MPRRTLQTAKLTAPRLPGALPRTRLFQRLDAARAHPVVWVTGPPGAGKTTLAGSYLEARDLPVLWYQVDEGDADVASFFYYLGQAVRQAAPRRRRAMPLFTPEYQRGLAAFTRNYFETLFQHLPRPAALVFDNFHEAAADSPFQDMIAAALAMVPAGANVIVLSRAPPPPALARLLANGQVAVLGWEDLRLTEAEVEALLQLRSRPGTPTPDPAAVLARTEGWAAGLILLQEAGAPLGPEAAVGPGTQDQSMLFAYFAGEVFDRTDPGMQTFLLKTAFLPRMTVPMAAELSGDAEAGRRLAQLERLHYFTLRHAASEPLYQYHPLFRRYLLARAEEALSAVELTVVKWTAARLLEADHQLEAAVELLRAVQDWRRLGELIRAWAPALSRQGRYRTLAEWIAAMPPAEGDAQPWLAYWQGSCRYPYAPHEALPCFERAFQRFMERGDAEGSFLAWAGAVMSLCSRDGDLRPLDRWVGLIDELLRVYPEFPGPEVELRFARDAHAALVFRMPWHPDRRRWRSRCVALLRALTDPSEQVRLGSGLANEDMMMGDEAEAAVLIEDMRTVAAQSRVEPVALSTLHRAEAYLLRRLGRHDECLETVDRALVHAERTGVHIWDMAICIHGAVSAVSLGDAARARALLERVPPAQRRTTSFMAAFYQYACYCVAYLEGDLARARTHALAELELSEAAGAPFFQVTGKLNLAQALFDLGEGEAADAALAEALEAARTAGTRVLEFMCLLLAGHHAFRRGHEAAGREALAQAFALARQGGYLEIAWLPRPVVAELCAEALRQGIETDYVRDMVRSRRLIPETPPLDLESWPWPVRVYTLGRFEVLRDDAPLGYGRKPPRRPLQLLRALIALGGTDVAQSRLVDLLWPDQDAGAGHEALTIALHRLRQLLGGDTVVQQEGRLSIDRRRCWVDASAFEEALRALRAPGADRQRAATAHRERALALYAGHFLVGDIDQGWAVPPRERLRSLFIHEVEVHGLALEEAQAWSAAADWYRRALEADPLAEIFYQRLMHCLGRLDRQAEAVQVYRRCVQVLQAGLGVSPAEATQAAYRRLGSE